MRNVKTFLKLIRIKHWIKNVICFVPLIFSLNFTNPALSFETVVAFFAFCLTSSAIYIFNDIFDIEEDKRSREKSKRPLASGKISVHAAYFALGLFLLLGLFMSAFVNPLCLLVSTTYIVLNVFYTAHLKNIEIIDAFCIALGFILRILSGCAAIAVLPSPLVILLTFFVSMFFTFSKRRLEFIKEITNKRKSAQNFNIETLNQFVCANAMLSIAFYFAYMLDPTAIERTGADYLYITTIPFALIIFRLLLLANTSTLQDPAEFLYKDKPVQILFLLYFTTLLVVLTV